MTATVGGWLEVVRGWRAEVGGRVFGECWGPAHLSLGAGRAPFCFCQRPFGDRPPGTEGALRETEAWEQPGPLAGPEL